MTYKLNPSIAKILSPVVLILPDGSRRAYVNGVQAAEDTFEDRCVVDTIRAVGDAAVVALQKINPPEPESATEGVTFF